MPTVAAEAMMHRVPCLLSDAVGTVQYIEDGRDGILFESEDVEGLANKIQWCIVNRGQLSEMGRRARCVYEKVFSVEAFEEKIISLVQGI